MWYDLKGRFYTPFNVDTPTLFADIYNENKRFEEAEKHSKVHNEDLRTAAFFILLDWFKRELINIGSKEDTTLDNFIARAEKELEGMLYRYKITESQAITLGICIGERYERFKLADAMSKITHKE